MRLTILAFTFTTALTSMAIPPLLAQQPNQADIAAMQGRLAEAETSLMSLKAERDEYRSLLHRERQRLKEISQTEGQIAAANAGTENMVQTIRDLEAEKVDLMRQLEYAKRGPQEAATLAARQPDNSAELQNRLNAIQTERQELMADVRALEDDKQSLVSRLQAAENDLARLQQQKSQNQAIMTEAAQKDETIRALESEIAMLRNQNRTITENANYTKTAELRALESEVASLEAQNKILRQDVVESQKIKSSQAQNANQQIAALENKYSGRFRVMENENIRLTRELETEKNRKPEIVEKIVEVEKIVPVRVPAPTQVSGASVSSSQNLNRSAPTALSATSPVVQTKSTVPDVQSVSVQRRSGPLSAQMNTPTAMVAREPREPVLNSGNQVENTVAQIQWNSPQRVQQEAVASKDSNITVMAENNFKSERVLPSQNAQTISPNEVRRSLRSRIVKQETVLPERVSQASVASVPVSVAQQPMAIAPQQVPQNVVSQEPIISAPLNSTSSQDAQPVQVASYSPSTPVQTSSSQEQALSGDKIKRLVMDSNIPVVGSIERVAKVSGPDFAAFRWDTGQVYGSAEQTRLSSPSGFNRSVDQYISKIQSRCQGSFDQTNATASVSSGLTVRSVDMACISPDQTGATVSVLFFEENGMFYALAHEADLSTFETAMDLRDNLANNLSSTF